MFSSIESIPGLIFARSNVKAKIRPGVEARSDYRKLLLPSQNEKNEGENSQEVTSGLEAL